MSKVYVLLELTFDDDPGHFDNTEVVGVIKNESVAKNWINKREDRDYVECELNNPELLNRIAKENK